jgi:hypothetical protein
VARALFTIGLIACVIVGWHLYAASDTRRQAEELRAKHSVGEGDQPVVVNVITDVVTVPIVAAAPKTGANNPLAALGNTLGSMLGGALAKALEPSFERDLNLQARENYDLYAILLPYRVRIVTAGTED